jgi:AcrR family transcriptional regulator
MDAAEALFIRLGYEGSSIRAISARAKLNLSTVVYHWGTKEALFRAVCDRRFGAIGHAQMEGLLKCEVRYDELGPDDIDEILAAFVVPPVKGQGSAKAAHTARLLYGRVLTDPSPVVLRITAEMFNDLSRLVCRLLQKCLAGTDEETFYQRWICALGAMIFAQSFGDRVAYANNLPDQHADWGRVAQEIIAFMKAGLKRTADA